VIATAPTAFARRAMNRLVPALWLLLSPISASTAMTFVTSRSQETRSG